MLDNGKYWKVNKKDIKEFPNIDEDQIKLYNNVCNGIIEKYEQSDYIYIITYDDIPLSFMPYTSDSIFYFKVHKHINAGLFKSKRELRKEKLQKILNINE